MHAKAQSVEQRGHHGEGELQRYLGVYKVEPLGWLLERFHLSPLAVGSLAAIGYFGVLLILHSAAGHPPPDNFVQIFSHPRVEFYYPNLIGIAIDLIGNPLVFLFLVVFRSYIPRQFLKLLEDGLIEEKRLKTRSASFLRDLVQSRPFQVVVGFGLPMVAGIALTSQMLLGWSPTDTPGKYAAILSVIAYYARIAVIVQLLYVLVIMRNYSLTIKITLNHPDRCSGLSAFGNLALGFYAFLFHAAMFQAIITSAGGGGLDRFLFSIYGSSGFLYLWLLFPLAILLIFEMFVFRPHRLAEELKTRQLEKSSREWTDHHHMLLATLQASTTMNEESISTVIQTRKDDLALLETWTKLNDFLGNAYTWPISTSTLRIVGVALNPLIPIGIDSLGRLLS